MKKLIIASALLSLIALPATAQSNDPYSNDWNYGDYAPEQRENHWQGEILDHCVNTNKYLYCADTEESGIYQINDSHLYNNCSDLGGVIVNGECLMRGNDSQRLIQVNPTNY